MTPDKRSQPPTIGVIVFHERARLRAGLREMLRPYRDIVIVGEADSADAAVEQSERLKPHVVVMDVQMPLVDGADCVRRIRETSGATQVVLVSIFSSEPRVVEAVRAGARAYVNREWLADDLAEAIRVAHNGGTSIPGEIMGELLRVEDAAVATELTQREAEILRLLEAGARNKEIAAELWVSEGTVKFHLANLYQKLGVTTRTRAVHRARQRGLFA